MFITSSYPEVVSFNTGAPFLVFSRNPQIRLTKDIKNFRVILTALSQIDFKSTGPDGPNSKYLRNAAIPSMNINLEYAKKNAEQGNEFLVGIAGNFKRLIPRLETYKGYKTTEGINSFSGMAYLKLASLKSSLKWLVFTGRICLITLCWEVMQCWIQSGILSKDSKNIPTSQLSPPGLK